jgi:hypothetical protein
MAFAPIQQRERDEGEEYCSYPDQKEWDVKSQEFLLARTIVT